MKKLLLLPLSFLLAWMPLQSDMLDHYMLTVLPSIHASRSPHPPSPDVNSSKAHALMAWNDLGMHCMDGNDYSVFSILPPYNTLHAQLKHKEGGLVTTGVTLSYVAVAGERGVLNTTSMADTHHAAKTNFWDYVAALFGFSLSDDTGLTGVKTPSEAPQPMHYNAAHGWWEAEGIPITPLDDDSVKNFYPRVKVIATDAEGNVLADAITVLPVSDEMDCRACHGSLSGYEDAMPEGGWVNDPDAQKDYKLNILKLHDQRHPDAVADHEDALNAKGYVYNAQGLSATQAQGTPILCAACHRSNALPGTGVAGVKPLTQALHTLHSDAPDPQTGIPLDQGTDRTSCYLCHPGAATQCLRGAMGTPKNPDGSAAMDCQSCHGNMSQVGSSEREGWLEQPNCQACHQDGNRYLSALNAQGTLRDALDTRFATTPDTPAEGISLYRYSRGHGELQCEACHGATHAIYPTHEAGDNVLSERLQGHAGTVAECIACHANVPLSAAGGPHGMHTTGQRWVDAHEHYAEQNPAQCRACHGQDSRGSALSAVWAARSFSAEHHDVTYEKGDVVSCYDCHDGPDGD